MSRGDDDETDVPRVSDADARAIDERVRALRDSPVAPARLAHMRAALDARIEAATGIDDHAAATGSGPLVALRHRPRWRRLILPAAAALAAAILAALLLPGREREQAQPPELAPDAMERIAQEIRADEGGPLEGALDSPAAEGATRALEPAAAEGATLALEPAAAEGATRALEPAAAEGATLALEPAAAEGATRAREPAADDGVAVALESSSDEELAVALEYDRLADYDVIEQLELLELLDELEAEGRI